MTTTEDTPNPYPDNIYVGGWTEENEDIVLASWEGEVNGNIATFGVIQPDFCYEFQAADEETITLYNPDSEMKLEILTPLSINPRDSVMHELNISNPQITIAAGARFILNTPADSLVDVVYVCEYSGSLPWLKH